MWHAFRYIKQPLHDLHQHCEAQDTIELRAVLRLVIDRVVVLHGVNLEGANLSRANLREADLRKSNLEGVTMPDGKVYDPAIHGFF